MCDGSEQSKTKSQVEAEADKTYNITMAPKVHGGIIAVLSPAGTPASECVACLRGDVQVTLNGIPAILQKLHGIGPTAVVTFKEKSSDQGRDRIVLSSGKDVPLATFANYGIAMFVGVQETPDDKAARTVGSVITDALAGAKAVVEDDTDDETGGRTKRLEDA
jgi:hypothetical protein